LTSGLTDRRPIGEAGHVSAGPIGTPPGEAVEIAVVLATGPGSLGGPAALAPLFDGTVLARLTGQLSELGVPAILVITRPAWQADVEQAVQRSGAVEVRASHSLRDDLRLVGELASAGGRGLLLLYGDMVTHTESLAGLLAEPRAGSTILAGGPRRYMAYRVHVLRGRVTSAASPYHSVRRHNGSFLGVLRVAPGDLGALATAAERLAPLLDDLPEPWQAELARKTDRWRATLDSPAEEEDDDAAEGDEFAHPDDLDDDVDDDGEETVPGRPVSDGDETRLQTRVMSAREDAIALLLVGLVRSGTDVGAFYLRRLIWTRPLFAVSTERVAERLERSDEDRLLLDSSVKSNDGFFTTFFVSPYSKHAARWAARRGLSPNQVTTASMLIGVLAAAAFATGERWGLVAGAVLVHLAFTTDCVDGQLARYTRTFSRFGAWLDSVFDRAKEYLVMAGLAIGSARAGDPVWLLACYAIGLQTIRHMSDFAYMATRKGELDAARQPPLEQPLDSSGAAAAARRRAANAPRWTRRRRLAWRVLRLWHAVDDLDAMRWIKKMITFPIGERFALIAITAAFFSPRTTFVALLAWGGLGFAYVMAGRVLRSVR
jgi:phosphatidylglycerophosphate synthase